MTTEMPAALKPEEAFRRLGISRSAGYAAVQRGEIPAIRIGRRIIVPVAALDRMLNTAGGSASI